MIPFINYKYKIDTEIPGRIWNTYLTKYEDKYRVHFNSKNKENIMCIWCKPKNRHFIQPYSIVKKELVFVGTFNSKTGVTRFIKKLPKYCKISQEAETEINVVFPEDRLEKLVDVFGIYCKPKFSEERREFLRKKMAEVRAEKKTQIPHKRPAKGILY